MLGAACSLDVQAVQETLLPFADRDFQTQPTLAFGQWGTTRKNRITILPNSNLLLSANSTLRSRVLKFLINSFARSRWLPLMVSLECLMRSAFPLNTGGSVGRSGQRNKM
jgi:hypothetical protein